VTEDHPYFLIPGFSQTPPAWADVVDALPPGRQAEALTVPLGLDFHQTAAHLAGERRGTWAGYSMGGRLALQIAIDHPAVVDKLALISSTAGIADQPTRDRRRLQDDELAAWIETNGTEAFLERWLARPLFAGLDREGARRHRLRSASEVAGQLRRLGQGVQLPLWDRLAGVVVPVAVVAGEQDTTYSLIAAAMASAIGPNATLHIVPGAGHALLLEKPDLVAGILSNL